MSLVAEESFIHLYQSKSSKKVLSHLNSTVEVENWNQNTISKSSANNVTHFGYIFDGEASLNLSFGKFQIKKGMYFSTPGELEIYGNSSGLLISHSEYRGFFHLGGPVEDKGRLMYIDGCTDSLLIPPPVMGDPCLNLLHIPKNTFQSQHTHPSLRAGIIISGSGECITNQGISYLIPGLSFIIPAEALHSFKTYDEELLVLAYHPDSDFGPTHENHPMINRTIL
ncbi:MAG: cupin domain-containing protein [bacterium]|nr:cupin domain-containing protein [bacterium]